MNPFQFLLKHYRLLSCLLAIFLLCLAVWYWLLLYIPAGDGKRVHGLVVAKGADFASIAAELEQSGVIRSALHLRLVGRLKGADRKVQAGDYRIASSMLPDRILEKLINGQTDACKFTLPEGYSIFQAAELLERQGVFGSKAFLAACSDRQLLDKLGLKAATAEGYLFPGTYQIGFEMDERELVKEMVREFRHRSAKLATLFEGSHLTMHQVMILASMVEREAMNHEERPLIASVFLNRLRIGMPLQSDPTAIYGVRHFGGKVHKEDLRHNSPYNTYKVKGLPAGPIGNPGLESIRAVLQPARTEYLYFVARKDGTHQFSHTLSEHNQGVRRFLKRGKR